MRVCERQRQRVTSSGDHHIGAKDHTFLFLFLFLGGWVGVVVFGVLKFSTGAWLVSMLVRRGMQALEGQALALLLMCKDFLAVELQLWIKLFYQESGLHVEEQTLI